MPFGTLDEIGLDPFSKKDSKPTDDDSIAKDDGSKFNFLESPALCKEIYENNRLEKTMMRGESTTDKSRNVFAEKRKKKLEERK